MTQTLLEPRLAPLDLTYLPQCAETQGKEHLPCASKLVSNKRPRRHTAPLLPAHAESANHQPADTPDPPDGQACPESVSDTQPQPVITDPGEQQRHATAESDTPGRKRKQRATISVPGTVIRRQQDREALPLPTIVHEQCPQSSDMRYPNDAYNTDKDCVPTQRHSHSF